eukprot:TRINITY_DN2656_c0_g1_i1.p1 TRINITY_DN2656_c0_g1~~TRINITY_DN2656_c0_g1_i1.p1  ORF type:complete len:155 (+),score=43.69 TRINITY_DN2656_c0_g1_i1:77-541(+)
MTSLPSPRAEDRGDPALQEVIRTFPRVEQLMNERKRLDDEIKSMPSLKEHLLGRLQRISEEVNEEQRAVQVLEAELTRTDQALMQHEHEIERARVEMDLVRDEIHHLEHSLHPHSVGQLHRGTAPWTRLFAPVLIGAGVLGTALYWTQSGSVWI